MMFKPLRVRRSNHHFFIASRDGRREVKRIWGRGERERECGQGRGAAKLEQKRTENTEITAIGRKSRHSNIK
jgi:hypothetical protein